MSVWNASAAYRVFRGGGWRYDPQFAQVAYCYGGDPGDRYDSLGVRFVRRES